MSADRPPQQPHPGNQWPSQGPWEQQGDAPRPAGEPPQVHGVPVASGERRPEESRPKSPQSGLRMAQLAMAVLFALAMVATVVMVFSDNELWMRIGLLAALWSALVGALLFARERRQTQTSADREAELKRVYSLELESEVSARRERELSLREELREEVRAENEESISSLRVEVMALRSQLEQLGVQPIVDGDPAVGSRTSHPLLAGRTGDAEDAARPRQDEAREPQEHPVPERPVAQERPASQTPPRPRPYDEMPSTEVTSSMRKLRPQNAGAEAPGASPWAPPSAPAAREVQPDDVVAPEVPSYRQEPVPEPAAGFESAPAPASTPEPKPAPTPEPSTSATPEPEPTSGPHTDRFRSFEGFRLSAPPSFTDDAELPDFDAPTGFEPATNVESRERTAFGAEPQPTAEPSPEEAPISHSVPEFFGRHGRDGDDQTQVETAANSDLYAPRHGGVAEETDTSAAEPAAEPVSTGRRAAAEPTGSRHADSGGTSVADLLARLGDGGQPSGGGGRRRRED